MFSAVEVMTLDDASDSNKNQKEVVAINGGIYVTRRFIRGLIEVGWMNDMVMNSYMHLLNMRVSGVITVPVSASMYQTMVANIQHLHTNSDGTVCVTPVVQVPKVEPSSGDNMETLTVTQGGLTTHSMMIQGSGNDPPQVLQVLSLKDATVLTKAMASIADVKTEETIISDQ